MPRAALSLSVALLVLVGCGDRASASQTVDPVDKAVARLLPNGLPDLYRDPPAFSFSAGTHDLRVPIALGARRSARVRVDVSVEHGPHRGATISVRR